MTRHSTPQPQHQPQRSHRPRARLVLLLLVGLLGMHGLASQHATAAMADPTPMTMTMTMTTSSVEHAVMALAMTTDPATAGRRSEPAAGVVAPPAASSVLAASGLPHGGMAMADLCLAVLTGALLLLRAATAHADRAPRTACRADRLLARVNALPRPRAPDLVAGLCVSRT